MADDCACTIPARRPTPAGWPEVLKPGGIATAAPGGVPVVDALATYGSALVQLWNTDPARALGLVVGGSPGAIITAFVENRGNVSAATKQSACDLAIAYDAAAVLIPAITAVVNPVLGVTVGLPLGAFSALLAGICHSLCDGRPLSSSVVAAAVNAGAGLAGVSVPSTVVQQAQAQVLVGKRMGQTMRTETEAEALIIKGVLDHAPDKDGVPVTAQQIAHAAGVLAIDMPMYASKGTLGTPTNYVPLKTRRFAADWNHAGQPMKFWTLVSLLRYRFPSKQVDLAVARFPRRPVAPPNIGALRGSIPKAPPKGALHPPPLQTRPPSSPPPSSGTPAPPKKKLGTGAKVGIGAVVVGVLAKVAGLL